MSKGGSSTSTIDPQIFNLLNQNVGRATGIANQPFQPYTGQLTAGMNADQSAAESLLQYGKGVGTGALDSGVSAASGAAQYIPQSIIGPQASAAQASPGLLGPASLSQGVNAGSSSINRGGIQNVNGGNLLGGIAQYQNPYTTDVINSTLSDIDRSRQMAINQNSSDATMSHAFGGSRQGVADAQTNEAYGRIGAQTAAQLRNQGFDTASNLAQSDASRALQAGQSNQGIDLSVANQNAGYGQQSGLFNAGNALQNNQFNSGVLNNASQFNAGNQQQTNLANMGANNQVGLANQNSGLQGLLANQSAGLQGAGLNLNAAGILGNLGNDQFNNWQTGANSILGFGNQAQQTEQAQLSAMYQEFMRQQGYSPQMQTLLNQSLGLLPAASGTQTQAQNNTGGLLGGLGDLFTGAGALKTAGIFSDANLKTEIRTIRYDGKGRRWVAFRYLWDEPGTIRHGVMAQEIEKTEPHAVTDTLLGKMVNYSMLEAA